MYQLAPACICAKFAQNYLRQQTLEKGNNIKKNGDNRRFKPSKSTKCPHKTKYPLFGGYLPFL
jgi:hypothetical protein